MTHYVLEFQVKSAILENFAGPPDTGVFSASVQQTIYLAQVKKMFNN
jgi:hypothetical protein